MQSISEPEGGVDEEYNLILHYPSVFASEPEDADEVLKRFPSRFDSILLQYWSIPNTYEDTLDSFVENMPAEEIYVYNNVAIEWKNDLDQLAGEVTPTAYFARLDRLRRYRMRNRRASGRMVREDDRRGRHYD